MSDGSAGRGGSAGSTGSGGVSGSAGSIGSGGGAGSGGTLGAGGSSGSGAGGSTGPDAGSNDDGGTAGSTGAAGAGGTGGYTGGAAGSGGANGSAGSAATGTGGASGSTGAAGSGGSGGNSGSTGVSYSPPTLDFGSVDCGTQGASQDIVFANSSSNEFSINASLGSPTSPYTFTITPANGLVAPNGGMATITVTPNTIPPTSQVPGNYGDVLTVTTSASGDSPHTIQLSEIAHGAILGVSPTALNFPRTQVTKTSAIQILVTNSGNAPATIVFNNISPTPPPNGTGVFDFQQNQVALPGSAAAPNATFSPTAVQTYSGTAQLGVTNTVLCAPLPGQNITMHGSSSNAPPPVVVSPGTINFGPVSCGATAQPSTAIKITNNTNGPIDATASFANTNGNNFTASIPGGGVIPANSTVTVTVSPNAIPVAPTTQVGGNHFGDTLTISTNAAGDGPHTINVNESAQGAILVFSPAITHVPAAFGSHRTFKVQNQGNIAANFTLVPSVITNPPYIVAPLSSSINAVGSGGLIGITIDVTKAGNPATSETVAMTVPTGQVICQPLPAPEQLVTP